MLEMEVLQGEIVSNSIYAKEDRNGLPTMADLEI